MAIIIPENFNYMGGENLESYKPWPHAVNDPHIGEIRPEAQTRQENIFGQFIGPDETFYSNPAVNDNDLPVTENDELELRRARRSKLLDTLFGIFGKASDVYEQIKYGEEEKPYQLEISAGQEYRGLSTGNYILIGAGILTLIVLAVSLKTK